MLLCEFNRPDAGATSDVKRAVDVFSYRRKMQRSVGGDAKRMVLQV